MLCSASEESLVKVPLRFAGWGSRLIKAGHHTEDRLFQRHLRMLRFQLPYDGGVEGVEGLDQARVAVREEAKSGDIGVVAGATAICTALFCLLYTSPSPRD